MLLLSPQVPAFCWSHTQSQSKYGCKFSGGIIPSFSLNTFKSPHTAFMDTAHSGSDHTGWPLVPTNIPQPFNPGEWEVPIQEGYSRPLRPPNPTLMTILDPGLAVSSALKLKIEISCNPAAPSLPHHCFPPQFGRGHGCCRVTDTQILPRSY